MPGYLKKIKTKKTAVEPRECPVHGTFVLHLVLPDQTTLDAEAKGQVFTKGPKKGEFSREKWAPLFVKNRFRGWEGLTEDIFFGYLGMGMQGYDREDPELKKVFAEHEGEFPYSADDAADILLKIYDDLMVTPVIEFLDSWKAEIREGTEADDRKSA